jgi:predicted ATPase
MGVGSKIQTIDQGKLGHELKIATAEGQNLQDLTQVGVGVSQVLPILVLSLLADPGSTLIFEQPELHLHPRVQTRLADFFVSMTHLGKQCVVETHSEYLINRLRYQAAASQGRNVSDSVILYFVEKEGGRSQYRPVRINMYGVIEDWPRGFFDENEENAAAILRAGLNKRRSDTKENDGKSSA